ncbi:MAG TPA: hypothetical protein DCQ64_01470 [Candidatus Rokubacteria bacterium]|nr:hypothetical protein [Candidatus Rokubacteria bacterium]
MVSTVRMFVCNRSSGWRWPLREDVQIEVFSPGHDLMATVEGPLVIQVLGNFLTMAALQASLQGLDHLRPMLTVTEAWEPPPTPAERTAAAMRTLQASLRSRKGIKMPARSPRAV